MRSNLREINEPLSIEEVQIDIPTDHEVLVRTAAVGVCHSDWHLMNGSYGTALPSVMGHEAAGVVEKVESAVSYLKPGDHVISCMSMFCGGCRYCLTGMPYSCEDVDSLLRTENQRPRLSQNGQVIHQG